MTLLFIRLADLFGGKAALRGLIIFCDAEKGIYSETFELWCRKLNDLSPKNFQTGIAGLERKAEIDYREGNEMWPPSYAEFRALAFPKTGRETQAHKYFPPVAAIEDLTAKAKRYELGRLKTAELLAEIGASPRPIYDAEQSTHAKEFARIRLEQAKRLLAEQQKKNASGEGPCRETDC